MSNKVLNDKLLNTNKKEGWNNPTLSGVSQWIALNYALNWSRSTPGGSAMRSMIMSFMTPFTTR